MSASASTDAPCLLLVADSFRLPGLGLLARAAGPTPLLDPLPLHTALAVELRLPDGQRRASTASIEEVADGHQTQRALLLADDTLTGRLPPGTEIHGLLPA